VLEAWEGDLDEVPASPETGLRHGFVTTNPWAQGVAAGNGRLSVARAHSPRHPPLQRNPCHQPRV